MADSYLKSKIGIWFSTSHEYDQRDFEVIQKYGNQYHPSLGHYKSRDANILKIQLNWIRHSMIDFWL